MAPSDRTTHDDSYEDLLSLWADLEVALSMLLTQPREVAGFAARLPQLRRWLYDLVDHDGDAGLYVMFQLAAQHTSCGYSVSHALVCATLCGILAQRLQLPAHERDSLVDAALVMNIGMTALQNQLAWQREPLTAVQQEVIAQHPRTSRELLASLAVTDALTLDVVLQHHQPQADAQRLHEMAPAARLVRILNTIDRYAALISPRKSRTERSAIDSARSVVGEDHPTGDEVGHALVRTVGLCPPGTFVRLDNDEIAVVLRRSDKTNHPLVASIQHANGTPRSRPLLLQTAHDKPRIRSALTRTSIVTGVSPQILSQLGLYATRNVHALRSLVAVPGSRPPGST